jgi:16S rRNA (cytosine1402-N4)-methyltransferase
VTATPDPHPHANASPPAAGAERDPTPEFTSPEPVHRPVLLAEVLEALRPRPGAVIVDGTAGAGGHTAALARAVLPGGRVLGLDRDPEMLALAGRACEGLPVTFHHRRYDQLEAVLRDEGISAVDAVVVDLGLSSDQLAWRHRGFSFREDGPLDMRFDPDLPTTAADVVNRLPADAIADILYTLGEERHSRRIARRIVEARKRERIETTGQLAALIRSSIPGRHGPIDPATRSFQALRIHVNNELEHLKTFLDRTPDLLAPGGRLVAISFHSLEDRIVKTMFRADARLEVLTKKPITATDEEVSSNPRSRSAKLRVAQRCATNHPAA